MVMTNALCARGFRFIRSSMTGERPSPLHTLHKTSCLRVSMAPPISIPWMFLKLCSFFFLWNSRAHPSVTSRTVKAAPFSCIILHVKILLSVDILKRQACFFKICGMFLSWICWEQNGDVYLPLNFKTECDSFSFSLVLGKCGISAKVARMVA